MAGTKLQNASAPESLADHNHRSNMLPARPVNGAISIISSTEGHRRNDSLASQEDDAGSISPRPPKRYFLGRLKYQHAPCSEVCARRNASGRPNRISGAIPVSFSTMKSIPAHQRRECAHNAYYYQALLPSSLKHSVEMEEPCVPSHNISLKRVSIRSS